MQPGGACCFAVPELIDARAHAGGGEVRLEPGMLALSLGGLCSYERRRPLGQTGNGVLKLFESLACMHVWWGGDACLCVCAERDPTCPRQSLCVADP